MLHLVLVTEVSGASREPIPIAEGGLRIGRHADCDLQIPDQHVSGVHAELRLEGDDLVLWHRSRTNTTRVNGEIVETRRLLRAGDSILLAEAIELKVLDPAEAFEPRQVEWRDGEEPATATGTPGVADQAAGATRAVQAGQGASVSPDSIFVAIVGSGPAGLAAGVRAAVRGVPHVLIERSSLANTIERYQKGKLVMAEPTRLGLQPELQVGFQQGSREEILAEWNAAVERAGVETRIGPANELVEIRGEVGAFDLLLKSGDVVRATHVVIAIGLQGNLRRFGVPGDDLPHVTHQLDDPAAFEEKSVVVVGAGDAGIENALALSEYGNRVAIVNRREEFDRAKAANRSLLDAAVEAGTIALYKNTVVDHFEDRSVFLKTPDGVERLDADLVIGRLGAIPPRDFLERIGVEFPSPAVEAVPVVSDQYESNVPGIHLVGAVAGYPLIKNCLNQGFEVIEHIVGEKVVPADEPVLAAILEPLGLSVSEAIQRIRGLPLFSGLTPIQIRDFLFDSKVRRVRAGETVYERNDFDNTLLTVVEGTVRATVPKSPEKIKLELDEEVRTRLLTNPNEFHYGPGEFFGEIGLISGRRRGETVEALTDCVLIESPRLAMSRLLNSSDDVRRTIDATFASRAFERLMPGVTPEERQRLASRAETRSYKAGDLLFEQGRPADGLHLIRRGSVSLSQRREGREVVLQYVQAGNLLGDRGVLSSDGRFGSTVRAKTLVEALWIPVDAVRELFEADPGLEREMRARLDERVDVAASAGSDPERGTVMFLIDQTGAYEATDLLLIDESLCIRCNNCEKACASTHAGISRLDREAGPTHQSSSGAQLHLPTACQHCENPKCMDDCPPDALHRDRNGEVYVRDNCIGCGNCARNCPYGVIQMAALERGRPRGLLGRLLFGERDDASGEKKAVKCDLCMELPDPIGNRKKAACVASCPAGAIVRADPRKLVDDILQRA